MKKVFLSAGIIMSLMACNNASQESNHNTTKTSAPEVVAYDKDPRLDSYTQNFLHALNTGGGKPLETLTPVEARAVLVNAQAGATVDYSGIDEFEKTIQADSFTIKLNVVRPAGVKGNLPVFVFIHGGGWVLGDYPTHKRMVRDLAVLTGYSGVFINYTPTPGKRYPTQINEIYAATKWIAEHGEALNVDGKNMAIVGNSVGGNMSTITAMRAKAENGPAIKAQILFWPLVNADTNDLSYQEFGKDRFLTTSLMKWMYGLYADSSQLFDPYISPLQASLDQLKGLPPALIITAENDILREEGEAYGRKLDSAGVQVTTTRYLGQIHDFGLLNALANSPATRSAFLQAAAELKLHLKK
ncbi:acetyl esterase/lipase [Chitinophaga skermanii]|uniref:Acetyl esterase/lipase n=1 Tax=Chitinophaga skermanii TaxID=331697 RepID=A0A327QWQ6_9BACT|nr:alpha/beta hydrolase [Chitinophaga skermanii]RAJ08790.1 acetyl esterase/lipase [Chitinophaga skermanii]